jgi:predicted acylesterase/phospholipase RssA
MFDVLLRAYEVSQSTITMHSNLEADVVIRPQTRSVSLLQFSKGPQLVAAGRESVEQALPSLREVLPWL